MTLATSSDAQEGSSSRSTQAIDSNSFRTDSCQALQSDNQRKVLDIVDKLRLNRLEGTIGLPQLITVGDQSSGKSSVLEAITEIPFPRDEGLCTRFATTITLRRDKSSGILVKIIPNGQSDEVERKRLEEYVAHMSDFSRLPDVIAQATQVMGLKEIGETDYTAFSSHVLSIDISGPDRPALTLVDLPGFIHHGRDMDVVNKMVTTWMGNPRSIILAIITGRNDWDNQYVFHLCDQLDKGGHRTLGVITKPDTIPKRDIHNWIDLAQNKQPNLYFERGWHMLRNRGPDEAEYTFQQRNEAEKEFFNTGQFAELPRDTVGIEALRKRLSKLLFQHLAQELPSVREEILTKLSGTRDELQILGERRTTIQEQRAVLMNISMNCNNLLRSAVTGVYADAFFRNMSMEAAPDQDENIRRFRGAIQYLNMDFAATMHRQGVKYEVESGPGDAPVTAQEAHQAAEQRDTMQDQALGASLPMPEKLTRAQSIQWVLKIYLRSRGAELVGNFSPTLIGVIFRELTAPWESIALEHINRVASRSKDFIYKVIEHTAPAEFLPRLATNSIDAALAQALENCKKELSEIIKDNQGPPMTYCASWTTGLQKNRQRKHARIAQRAMSSSTGYMSASRTEVDPIKFAAEEALDMTRAYYKEQVKMFINNIAVQAVERHLVRVLPDIILSPVKVASLPDADVEYIAAEARETTQRRNRLEDKKKQLEKGLQTFRDAVGGLKR
ncbi:hypothetical protein N0V90_005426 [Kalmusia sp. IMI 367209]|nr:hypothetical protein N0V90_005426 [Kalmusia sp. IMI 367209]